MKAQHFTGIGKRENNEDRIKIDRLKSGESFFLIADGMGGYEKGEEAAEIISESIFTHLNSSAVINERSIQEAVKSSNLLLRLFNMENNIKSGATIGGIIVDQQKDAHLFWLGDVMIYHIKNSIIEFKTKSHTLLNTLIDSGVKYDQKTQENYKHIVSKSITGKEPTSSIGYHIAKYSTDAIFIICSDGVNNTVSDEQILLTANDVNNLKPLNEYLSIHSSDNFSLIWVE